jgi:hypothetical protein
VKGGGGEEAPVQRVAVRTPDADGGHLVGTVSWRFVRHNL